VTICVPAGIFFKAGWYQASACRMLATRLRCSSTAPLLTPVVPPVYCSTAMSSGPTWAGCSVMRRPRASASLKRTVFTPAGRLKAGTIFFTRRTTWLTRAPFTRPSMSPMLASTTVFVGTWSITWARVAAKFSRMMMALAPESLSWCSSSRGVYSGLTLTTTRPARRMAATATGYCGTLGIMTATRSPRCRPLPCSQAASAREASSTAPKLNDAPMNL